MFDRKLSNLVVLLVAFVAMVFAGTLGKEIGGNSIRRGEQKPPPEQMAKFIADKLTTELSLPMSLDADTQMDSVEASGKVLAYGYILVNANADSISVEDRNMVQAELLSKVCSTKETKALIDHGLTLRYIYRNPDRRVLMTLTFNGNVCSTRSS